MPHHDIVAVAGRVTDIFAHRFVLESQAGQRVLADIGPRAVGEIALSPGDEVRIEGERHPSEIRVTRLTRGGRTFDVEAKPKPGRHPAADRDPQGALDALAATGVEPLGAPRRKAHHYEIMARQEGELVEFHVHDDGRIHRAPHPAH